MKKEKSIQQTISKLTSTIKRGDFVTGYAEIDEKLGIYKGDLVTIQSITNHGKTTLMLQLMHQLVSLEENLEENPMCIFVTYESICSEVRAKFLEIADRASQEQPNMEFFKTIDREQRVRVIEGITVEKLGELVDHYQREFPNRAIILFLDHFQFIENSLEGTLLERNLVMAIKIRTLAKKKNILIFVASQVNEKRQTRGGLDLHNASTTVIDLINHSHILLNPSPLITSKIGLKKLYKKPVEGKGVCSLSVLKLKRASAFSLKNFFLFDGVFFERNFEK